MWLRALFPALHQVGDVTELGGCTLQRVIGHVICKKTRGLQYAQVLSSAVLCWLIEQISYFQPSYSCNYGLARKHSRLLMAYAGDMTCKVSAAQVE